MVSKIFALMCLKGFFHPLGNRLLVERQLDGELFEKTAVATKPKPNPLGLGAITPFRNV